MATPRIGKQPPRHTFFLNPYTDARFTKCPKCSHKTGQKKLPLVIHVDEWGPLLLNKTCRFCSRCDLLIAHKDEIDAQLAHLLERQAPKLVGNDYLVIGTLDRSDGKRGTSEQLTLAEMVQALHDFKNMVQFKPVGGWGPAR